MPKLITEILADYGTIPQRIGKFLKKRNGSRIEDIATHTSLTHAQVVQGLSLMIQRRLIKYFQYERQTYYSLDVNMVYRRMFYPMYTKLVEDEFGADVAKKFIRILVSGFVSGGSIRDEDKLAELLDAGVIIFLTSKAASTFTTISKDSPEAKVGDKICMEETSSGRKSRKLSDESGFYIIDFNILDSILVDNKILAFVGKRYSVEAEHIYRAITKCNIITVETVLEYLEPVNEGNGNESCTREKESIDSYFKYFNNCGIIKKSLDGSEVYFKDNDELRKVLTIDILNRILSMNGGEARRLFNLILEYKTLEDKDIALKSLLGSHVVKKALFALHSNGFILLKYSSANDTKPALLWSLRTDHTSKFVAEEIKRKLENSWSIANKRWYRLSWQEEEGLGDEEAKEIADLVGLASDLFILGG